MKNLICLSFLFVMLCKLQSQTLLSAGGSYHQGSTFNIHWSLGESVVDTHIDNNFTLSKGFHQGEQKINTSVLSEQSLKAVLFPNPSGDFIELSGLENISLEGNIFDNTGSIVKYFKIKKSIIDISDLKSGLYYVT